MKTPVVSQVVDGVINGAGAARLVVRLGQLLSDFFSLADHS